MMSSSAEPNAAPNRHPDSLSISEQRMKVREAVDQITVVGTPVHASFAGLSA